MALWEYKVITSGKGGFASPQLLENFLNQLGKEEWEIVEFRSSPENFLAFNGLARRAVQRDWTLEAAAAAQAKAEEEQRRADERAAAMARERETERNPAPDAVGAPAANDEGTRDESFRRPRDTELDQDPEALADEAGAADLGDWDELSEEDELPTLFEAVRPHLRRNQKGPGQSVAIDYLSKRWEQTPEDITGALLECGFTVPENEDSAPDYFEFEGDLYWLNKNNRGQLFLNVREKPRPAFRVTPVRKLDPSDPAAAELAAEHQAEVDRKTEQRRQQEAREAEKAAKAEAARAARAARETSAAAPEAGADLPQGEALLMALRPRMRQNRRGGGFSGSTGYLAKALRRSEAELIAALESLGLRRPDGEEKPEPVEIGGNVYWLNKDGRGGIWINGREKREGEPAAPASSDFTTAEGGAVADVTEAAQAADAATIAAAAEDAPAQPGDEMPPARELRAGDDPLVVLRPLLQANKRGGGAAAELGELSRAVTRPVIDVLEALVKRGLALPDNPKDRPEPVEADGEAFWLSRHAEDDTLWLNVKGRNRRRSGGSRGRRKAEPGAPEDTAAEEAADAPAAAEPATPETAAADGYTPEESTETGERT